MVWVRNAFSVLFVALPLVRGQSTNATCEPGITWVVNTRGQSPCLVAAYLMGACEADGQYTVTDLGSDGPNATYVLPLVETSLCTCSSVTYSMLSACAYCQGGRIPVWNDYNGECPAAILTNGSYPHVLPPGTAVPGWAYLPISPGGSGSWDAAVAEAFLLSHSDATPTSPPTPSPTIAASGVAAPGNHTRSIVGGAIGGSLGLMLLLGLGTSLWRRYGRKAKAPSAAFLASAPNAPSSPGLAKEKYSSPSPFRPTSDQGYPQVLYPVPTAAPLRIYNPDDPSTFPDAHPNGINRDSTYGGAHNVTSSNGVVYTSV